jgi:hypothetical protein
MTMASIRVTLHTGDCPLRVFASPRHFRAHVHSHFCNNSEPWSRLFGQQFLRKVCQNMGRGDVSLLKTLYARVVEVVRDGVAFSAGLPLYAVVEQMVATANAGERQRITIYFIAREGFVIVSDRDSIRTAYFPPDSVRHSAHTLFKTAWKMVKSKCAKNQYVDSKYAALHTRIAVHYENAANWHQCPNPHAKPAVGKARHASVRADNDNDRWQQWIRRYETD